MDQPNNQRSTRSMVSFQKAEANSSPSSGESNQATARSSISSLQTVKKINFDFNFLLKLMNKRKLHLPCPQCKALVVNLTDHLTKTHSVKNINERRNLIDSVRSEYILNEEGVHKLLEFNKDLKNIILVKKEDSFLDDLNASSIGETKEEANYPGEEENELSTNECDNSNSSRSYKKRKLSKPIKKPYLEVEDIDETDVQECLFNVEENKEMYKKLTSIENQLNEVLTQFNSFVSEVNNKINELSDQLKNTSNDLNLIKEKLLKD